MKMCDNCKHFQFNGKDERCLRTKNNRLCDLERAEYFPLIGRLFGICGYGAKFYEELKNCDFCGEKGDWKTVLKDSLIMKKDNGDLIVCNQCMNLYANQEWKKLTKRLANLKKR